MKTLQILIPMGGLGQRFRDAGFSTPKPLIEVDGKPMFLHALASFDAYDGPKEYIFVVRQDAEEQYGLASSIKDLLPDAKIALLADNTRGAAETCLLARDYIDNEKPLIVMDCDFRFISKEYFDKVGKMVKNGTYDGVLLSFESDHDRYSYARIDENDRVLETAEKKVISNHALWGAYCFSSGERFVKAVDELMKHEIGPTMKEYYISYVYGQLLKEGCHISLARVDTSDSFGTPEELQHYLDSKNEA